MSSVKLIDEILRDLWNFHLILMGISLSIFTLFYSFILSKKDQLLELSFQIKIGNNDPLFSQRERNLIRYIKKLKKFNDQFIFLTIFTFLIAITIWFLTLFSDNIQLLKLHILYFFSFVTGMTILYAIYLIASLFLNYIKDTRVS